MAQSGGREISQFMVIMMADRFEDSCTMVRKIYKLLDMDIGDFCLHVDAATQKAYIWFDRPHFELVCATLTDDYTACSGEYSEYYKGLYPPFHPRGTDLF